MTTYRLAKTFKPALAEEAKKTFAGIDVAFVIVAEGEGSATNLENKNRAMSGGTTNSLNLFFHEDRVHWQFG